MKRYVIMVCLLWMMMISSTHAMVLEGKHSTTPFSISLDRNYIVLTNVPRDSTYKYWVVNLKKVGGTYSLKLLGTRTDNNKVCVTIPASVPNGNYYVNLYHNNADSGDYENYSYERIVFAKQNGQWKEQESVYMSPVLSNRKTGLEMTDRINWGDPAIVQLASTLSSNKSQYQAVQSFYNYIQHNIKYDTGCKAANVYDYSATSTLYTKEGVCSGISCLFAALCRASGIPCKVIAGSSVSPTSQADHAWNEVYIGEDIIYVDPTWGLFDPSLTYLSANHFKQGILVD